MKVTLNFEANDINDLQPGKKPNYYLCIRKDGSIVTGYWADGNFWCDSSSTAQGIGSVAYWAEKPTVDL